MCKLNNNDTRMIPALRKKIEKKGITHESAQ